MDLVVELGRPGRLTGARRLVAPERGVLRDPRAQRRDILIVDAVEPVEGEPPGRLLGGPRPRQGENRSMLEAHVIRVLGEPAVGEVERSEQLATPLLAPDRIEPPCCRLCLRRPAQGSVLSHAHTRHSRRIARLLATGRAGGVGAGVQRAIASARCIECSASTAGARSASVRSMAARNRRHASVGSTSVK
jgi:hypothetical protein